jgi:HYDIN/CFA65/VesB-like, Ig-like domain/Putative collagen-binding domain of a collagenase
VKARTSQLYLALLVIAAGTSLGCGSKAAASPSSNSMSAAVTLSNASLSFGNQAVGTSSTPQSVTLANSGNAALTISGMTVSGDYAQTNNCGGSVAAGGNCAIQVTFHPTTSGTRTGAVTITDNSANSPQQIALTGTGTTTTSGTAGPLRVVTGKTHFFTDVNGKAVVLSGSHTWDDFQDLSQASSPAAFDFTSYVNFLKAHGQNVTILWRKDLPTACNWGAGGIWYDATWPWPRTGPGTATDGLPQFDLAHFDQTYFDRLRARVIALQQAGIYAVVQLFDGLQLLNNRCANDGYPFTAGNNINGINDGGGTGSMTMTSANSITAIQDAYVQKVIDSVNDLDNVIFEPSEEAASNSTWWQNHMISLIHSYEAGKPLQHPVLYAMLTGGSDSTLYASAAEAVAPGSKISPTNNQGKVIINDSDHDYYGMWNDSAQTNRNYVWENFTSGSSVIFMDPYEIYWSTQNRNLCGNPVNGVCSSPDTRWDNLRNNLGYVVSYGNKMNLAVMTPQGGLSSTGYCLANASATGEYLVYAPNGGSFTVNLAGTAGTLAVEWLNPTTGAITSSGTVPGGSTLSFTPPFSGDAVLYLKG